MNAGRKRIASISQNCNIPNATGANTLRAVRAETQPNPNAPPVTSAKSKLAISSDGAGAVGGVPDEEGSGWSPPSSVELVIDEGGDNLEKHNRR